MSLATAFIGLRLSSPVVVASGPASHDVNQIALAEKHGAGAVVLKTVCSKKYDHMRFWPRPRYKLLDWDRHIGGRSQSFSLYSYEQGYSGTVDEYWEFIRKCKERARAPIIGSIFADEAKHWEELAVKVEENRADAIELDISSPHRPGSLGFETTFIAAIKAVVSAVKIPVLVKLASGSGVTDQAIAAEQCGAAAVTLCNRIRGLDVDVESRRPILHGYYAGIGGPWAKYYTMLHVAETRKVISIPISATGGTMTGEDVLKYILVGASTVQILSVIMVNGWETIAKMNDDIGEYMAKQGISSLDTIRGEATKHLTKPEDVIRWSGEPVGGPRNVWRS